MFFDAIATIQDDFQLSVLGESYAEVPECFTIARENLRDKIVNWGFLNSKQEYYKVLRDCDVCVSTADHEFFGVSMIEGALLKEG
jgi:glycosyltransferase involved in cell wall biosynthesis